MISASNTCSQAEVMAKCAPLCGKIFKMCPNGVIPGMKLQGAFKQVHARTPIYFECQGISDWASNSSDSLRKVARMYRMTKQYDEEQKKNFLKQALGMNVL